MTNPGIAKNTTMMNRIAIFLFVDIYPATRLARYIGTFLSG